MMEINYDSPEEVKNDARTISEKIADILTNALYHSKNARAVVLAIELEDGTSWIARRGSIPAQIGLARGLTVDAESAWSGSEEKEDDE